jgi:predicted GIY-YIG superfamily endonuclease
MFWVYVLQCADGSYYTGHTDDLEKRLAQHHSGYFPGCYTLRRRPLVLMFFQAFAGREEALGAEKQIKGWSRAKKQALIGGDWAELSRLARNSGEKSALRQAQGEREK